jgi:hypothetical protein
MIRAIFLVIETSALPSSTPPGVEYTVQSQEKDFLSPRLAMLKTRSRITLGLILPTLCATTAGFWWAIRSGNGNPWMEPAIDSSDVDSSEYGLRDAVIEAGEDELTTDLPREFICKDEVDWDAMHTDDWSDSISSLRKSL